MTDADKLKLIIDRPKLVSAPKRIVAGGVTVLFWALWIYLLMPVLTLLAWAFGIQLAYFELQVGPQFSGLIDAAPAYAAVIAVMGSALLGWARLEYIRFRHVRRRAEPVAVEIQELAQYAGISCTLLQEWHSARCIIAHHDANARLASADILR